jgi:aspartyl-tRNA(Asn)/glutamyl-tRNA(Gln) amidotransferase subunit A
MARTIRDVTLALDAVVGPEATDLRSLPMPEASWTRSLAEVHLPRKVGWSPTLGYARVDSEVAAVCEAAVQRLADAGTEVVPIDTVFEVDPVMDWIRIAMVGDERSLGHLRGTSQWDLVDPGHARLIDALGRDVTGAELLAAHDACHLANLRLVELFHEVPLLLTPTVAGQTGPAGGNGTVDGEETASWAAFTYPFNMTRSPAGTVCAGFTADGMPVGLQVVGPQHADVAVLRLLAVLEDLFAIDELAPV